MPELNCELVKRFVQLKGGEREEVVQFDFCQRGIHTQVHLLFVIWKKKKKKTGSGCAVCLCVMYTRDNFAIACNYVRHSLVENERICWPGATIFFFCTFPIFFLLQILFFFLLNSILSRAHANIPYHGNISSISINHKNPKTIKKIYIFLFEISREFLVFLILFLCSFFFFK